MRSNYTLTITVNAPERIGCTDVEANDVLEGAVEALEQAANRMNRAYDSDVRVDRAGATVVSTVAEPEPVAAGGGVFDALDPDFYGEETASIVNAVNGIGAQVNAITETLGRLNALAERAERYLR
jgi:hypothetical protein